MDDSYIPISSVCEYFSSTVVKMEGELAFLDSVIFDEHRYLHIRRPKDYYRTETVPVELRKYEDVFDYIEPWIPPTFYAEDTTSGQAVLFALSQPTHYKRSADNCRYKSFTLQKGSIIGEVSRRTVRTPRISQLGRWKMATHPFDTALDGCLSLGSSIINEEFALALTGEVPILVYRNIPVGYVNGNGGCVLHPAYRCHFGHRVQSFAEVVQ